MTATKTHQETTSKKQSPYTKTIIPWMGGKSRLVKKLLTYLPPHTCYAEPFVGSAALFFAKEPAKCEIINDTHGELINLYRVIQNHLDAFLDHCQWMLSSRAHFERLRETAPEHLTDIQRAVRFYYIQKHCYGGQTHQQTFGTATATPPRFNSHEMVLRLQAAHERLKRTYIEQLPWHKIITKYDRTHTLFYCDPPYWGVAGYGQPFVWEEYLRLKDTMDTCKAMVLLSINDHPDIRALFAGYTIVPLESTYTVNKKHTSARELLILNDHARDALGEALPEGSTLKK